MWLPCLGCPQSFEEAPDRSAALVLTVLHASVDLYFSTAAQADAAAAEQQLEAEHLAGAASHVQSTGPAKMLKGEGKPAAIP